MERSWLHKLKIAFYNDIYQNNITGINNLIIYILSLNAHCLISSKYTNSGLKYLGLPDLLVWFLSDKQQITNNLIGFNKIAAMNFEEKEFVDVDLSSILKIGDWIVIDDVEQLLLKNPVFQLFPHHHPLSCQDQIFARAYLCRAYLCRA